LAAIDAGLAPTQTQALPAAATRLRQAGPSSSASEETSPALVSNPYVPGEFEQFVQRLSGTPVPVRRLGADLMTGSFDGRGADLSPLVPAEYIVAPGDEILITISGSVEADLQLPVDRSGRIFLPRVGTVQVAGVRYSELHAVIDARVARIFKNYQLSVTLGQLRGIRIFVTGFVTRPGTYTVTALSTVVGALMRAGGPSAAGSFRQIELRRGGSAVATLDLYDLLLKGDRSADRMIQAADVVHVGPVGTQVGVIGSVNRPAVVELLPSEGVGDALRMAGGLSTVADRSRLAVERLQERTGERVAELILPRDEKLKLDRGDVLRAFSSTESLLSVQKQNKRIRIEGEVVRPGDYILGPAATLQDAVAAAGGLSPSAHLVGAQFARESVRRVQQESYERALQDLETETARAAASLTINSTDQIAVRDSQAVAAARLIDRLRALKPSGRVVLQMSHTAPTLPALLLEDGDRLYVPPKPTTVGVFGSVFNTGSFLFNEGRSVDDYLRLAGGPVKGADERSIFVVRINGQVLSGRQFGGTWLSKGKIGDIPAEPGDTVFVPENLDKISYTLVAKDWTQILYQFGLGIAGIASVLR
jgi:protein involved in polysaccharide export with SLBB domain